MKPPAWQSALLGRTFLHPLFDYLLIGGGLSLVCTLLVFHSQDPLLGWNTDFLPFLILLSNSAHFAASTVRLYSKPGVRSEHPLLTMLFPLLTMVVLVVCVAFPLHLGKHLQAFYLTWSPYHYSAQEYGLAIIYCVRSGSVLEKIEKRVFRWICMVPFLLAFLGAPHAGLGWLYPAAHTNPLTAPVLALIRTGLIAAAFLLPLAFAIYMYRRRRFILPLVALLAVLSNSVWWVVLDYLSAFFWATIFHGLQYLAIVTLFHVREQKNLPANQHGPLYHATRFYMVSLLLGYGLFYCWPYAFVLTGFGLAESVLLVTATINIHHFVVDAYIWRLGRTDSNSRLVTQPV